MKSGGVSSLALRLATNRVAGKALGDMLSVTFLRVLLMVREDNDTARVTNVSYRLGKYAKHHIRRI